MTYSKIVDPFNGKSYSIYENRGKSILNNYFKQLQSEDRHQNGGGGMNCGVVDAVKVPVGCYEAPDVSGYQAPCGQLPLDNAFMNFKGGRKSKSRRSARRRRNSRKSN